MRVFCDESGNTCLDLLNADQPLFSLASTNLDADVCRQLIAPLLRQGQAEAKYSKLKGTARGQAALLELFSSLRTHWQGTSVIDGLVDTTSAPIERP